MYCPKCRTEYKKGVNTCADCEIVLVEELPPAADNELPDKRRHPIRDQISKTIELIRNNQKAAYIFSIIVGVLFYFIYGIAKNLWARGTWRLIESIASSISPESSLNSITVVLIVIGVNIFTVIPAALVSSLLCAGLMIYVLRKQQLPIYLWAVACAFLLLVRKWHFWKAPDLGLMISSFIGPFLVAFIFITSIWFVIKFRLKRAKD